MFTDSPLETARSLRHHFHQHPELKFEETQTAKVVAERLRELGYQVTEGIAETGVLAELDTGRPGPVIAFRADMNALPIDEVNTFSHCSTKRGLMHACGYDGYTAILLLAAEAIIEQRGALSGHLKLIFQPAEEGGNGAARMIEEGVLENPKVSAIFGYHNRPNFPTGQVFVKPGLAMGGNDTFRVTVEGKTGHAAVPPLAVDALYLCASTATTFSLVVN